jgi:hypothetical protein
MEQGRGQGYAMGSASPSLEAHQNQQRLLSAAVHDQLQGDQEQKIRTEGTRYESFYHLCGVLNTYRTLY